MTAGLSIRIGSSNVQEVTISFFGVDHRVVGTIVMVVGVVGLAVSLARERSSAPAR